MAGKKNLVIVESPSKAKTIGKFLGSRYKVLASVGHVKDLPKSRMGVNIDNNFEPEYINVRGKAPLIKELKSAAKESDRIFLATDPDREGEAISWHICNLLGIKPEEANRIEFHEITKSAVTAAINNPRSIDMNLVDAQQGRRVIDRVVGYGISPVLWAKVSKGLSAGRVQSAALKLICDREQLINDFIPKDYWVLSADLIKEEGVDSARKKNTFTAKLDHNVDSAEEAAEIEKILNTGRFIVTGIDNKPTFAKPYAPYTTSVLQQDASIRLGFPPKKTMLLAQQLYDGSISIKGHSGVGGLITYMRTDSVRVNPAADAACKEFIDETYGKKYVGSNEYSNKSKNTQDAHEAIRPSHVDLTPDEVQSSMNQDQYKLYKLIWSRFVASRMAAACYDSTAVEIDCEGNLLKASGRKLTFDGFLKVYNIGSDEKDKPIPELKAGERLALVEAKNEKKSTEPPARFTEASLIKELEEKGIGRPSTYAPIVSTLSEKRYIEKEKKSVKPTELGMMVTQEIMEIYFPDVVNIDFTSNMEENLDEVAEGKIAWKKVVGDYYNDRLKQEIIKAKEQIEKIQPSVQLTDELCPQCGKPLALKHGRFGDFLACSAFPECRYTKSIVKNTGVKCPKCGGDIIVKRSKKGKTFYGCSSFPNCDQVFWYKPVSKLCPRCGNMLVERGRMLYCSDANCDYKEKK